MKPNLKEEKKLWKKGYKNIVGVDEAGRGCLAGPVVAAAVSLIANCKLQIADLKDSKKLSPQKREKIYQFITKNSLIRWGIGKVSEKVIDKINILEATKLAMKKAVKNLNYKLQIANSKRKKGEDKFYDRRKRLQEWKADFLILDGNFKIDLPIPQKSIIKGDEKIFSCALASILAKVTRDRIMLKYHKKCPKYRFDLHKGYPTKLHLRMLRKYGPSALHRKSFRFVKKMV